MSGKQEKRMRRPLEQYDGVVQDVDRLKREVAGTKREIQSGLLGLSEALTRHGEIEAEGRQAIFERMIQSAEDNVLWTVEVDERLRRMRIGCLATLGLAMTALVVALALVLFAIEVGMPVM